MKRRIAWVLGSIILVIVVAAAGSGYWMRALARGPAREQLIGELKQRLGVAVEVISVDFDTPAWYRLEPALTLNGVRLGNPPGFRVPDLMTVERLRLRLALKPLIERKLQVLEIDARKPVLTIEKARSGDSNLETFLRRLSGSNAGTGRELAIDRVAIEDGAIRYQDGTASTGLDAIQLAVSGFESGKPCRIELSTRLYGGEHSRAGLQGEAGPFTSEKLPLKGKMDLAVALNEVPEALRRSGFGSLLAAPGRTSRAQVAARVQGDVYGSLTGDARVTLEGIEAGRDAANKLVLSGEVPGRFKIAKLLSTPVVDFRVRKGVLRAGGGEWSGDLDLLMVGGTVRGKSSGAIRGAEIAEFLGALTDSGAKVEGQMAIPSYTVRFGGRNAEQIRRSLSGEAMVEVSQGKLEALDLLATIRRAVERPGGDATVREGQTEFTTLKTALLLGEEALALEPIDMDGPALRAKGQGRVTFDHALRFRLDTVVTGPLAVMLGAKATAEGPAQAVVPLEIEGTVGAPRVRPDLKQLAVNTGKNYLERILGGKKVPLSLGEIFRKK